MNDIWIDYGHVSFNKYNESVCGDFCNVIKDKLRTTVVLSDGLGSGVKANILATLTSKILSTLLARKLPLEECIYTVASTLPVCKERKLAYATFTAAQIEDNIAYLVQYDNPKAILLRNGKSVSYASTKIFIDTKEIYESKIFLEEGDMLILLSDGVTAAGMGKTTDYGWKHEEIVQFVEKWYTPDISPKRMAALIADACLALYMGETMDDTTALVIKLRKRKAVNIMIGPPENKSDDNKILRLFFAKEGKHVVCGGTTATTVSNYLNKPYKPLLDTATDTIPAIAEMEGVDLVTEGVITLEQLVQFAREYNENHYLSLKIKGKRDAVSLLADLLFEEATDINIFFGNAINPAHEGLDIDFQMKLKAIKALEDHLVKMNKNVKLSMC